MTKLEQINAINADYEKVCAKIQKRRDYRWKNYYDCIDDYSVCGICEQSDCMEEDAAKIYHDLRIEEVNNNGVHREVTQRYVLLDNNDIIVANRVIDGKFGRCFFDLVNNCYVGIPRKINTLTKKGYKLACIETAYECVVREVTIHKLIYNKSMKLISTKTTVLNEIPDYIPTGTPYSDYQYENYFAA